MAAMPSLHIGNDFINTYYMVRGRTPVANFVLGCWYAALLFLVIFFATEPQADFRYISL